MSGTPFLMLPPRRGSLSAPNGEEEAAGGPRHRSVRELSAPAMAEVEPLLLAFALRAVRRPDVARDLVQETYLAALEGEASFQGRSKLRTWLVGILSRKIVDHYRKHRREVLPGGVPEEPLPSPLSPSEPAPPDARLDQRRALGVVQASLASLTDLERRAVELCDVAQVDRKEASAAMGVTTLHLRVLLHRGRQKLRRALSLARFDGTHSPA